MGVELDFDVELVDADGTIEWTGRAGAMIAVSDSDGGTVREAVERLVCDLDLLEIHCGPFKIRRVGRVDFAKIADDLIDALARAGAARPILTVRGNTFRVEMDYTDAAAVARSLGSVGRMPRNLDVGLNADWNCSAWRTPGGLFVLDCEDGTYQLVRRTPSEPNDVIDVITTGLSQIEALQLIEGV